MFVGSLGESLREVGCAWLSVFFVSFLPVGCRRRNCISALFAGKCPETAHSAAATRPGATGCLWGKKPAHSHAFVPGCG